jgi:uracil-DNA glycosylase
MSVNKEKSMWYVKLEEELQKPYFKALEQFVKEERTKFTVYPKESEVFNALKLTSWENTRVVILGQDPYHGLNQAHGLSFSVNHGIKPPPSLVNIYKELHTDVGFHVPNHGNLTEWAQQGVLMLNATLTVRAGEPASHQKKGWEQFTDAVIKLISDEKEHCVFLLWGAYARSKAVLIDASKHLILEAAHPSPLARGAFFGSSPFSQANAYLKKHGLKPIDWQLKSI